MPSTPAALKQFRLFVWLAFVASWSIGGVGLLINHFRPGARALSTGSFLYYAAAYSISAIGILCAAAFFRVDGLRSLGRRLVPRRADAWAYVAAIITYGAITGLALVAAHGFSAAAHVSWIIVAYHLPVVALRDPGPIGEEFGWRGFALPRLLEGASPLAASLRLGIIHTLWHLPLFLIPGMPQARVSLLPFAVGVIAIAILDTVLYLRATSNLLLAIVVHLLANACGDVAKANDALTPFFLLEGAVAMVLVIFGALNPSAARGAATVAPTG
jgi:membrane protease YdiL (CAAX protease family)